MTDHDQFILAIQSNTFNGGYADWKAPEGELRVKIHLLYIANGSLCIASSRVAILAGGLYQEAVTQQNVFRFPWKGVTVEDRGKNRFHLGTSAGKIFLSAEKIDFEKLLQNGECS